MFKGKKSLAMVVFCAVASVGFVANVHAEELDSYKMDNIVVEDAKDVLPGGMVKTKSDVGILGNKDVMDTPFTTKDLSKKTIETFGGPNQPLQSVLVNNPSVRLSGTTLHNDFSIRGLKSTGTSTYVNGIPGLNTQFNSPTFYVEDIQFISGPNSGITGIPSTYESSSAGGIVNFVSKKAGEEPLNKFKQTFSGKGSFGEYIDISRRFGKNNEWGVRINAELLNGETGIDNQDLEAQGIYANIDHRSEHSKTNLLAGYRHINNEGGIRWFALKNVNKADSAGNIVTAVPDAPDASKNYGVDGLAKESEGYIIALNHEQEFAEDMKWFTNFGFNNNKLQRNIVGMGSRFHIINNAGDIKTELMSTQTVTKNRFWQVGINGKGVTGAVDHDFTVAVEKAWYSIGSAKDNYKGKMGIVVGNIFNGGLEGEGVKFPTIETGTSSKSQYCGVSFADTMKYKKSQLLVGVHKHSSSVDSYSAKTGAHNGSVDSSAVCPTYGYVYRPDDHVSLYASHSENFDKGTVVADIYENGGEILDPAKTKQNEIGIKYQNAGLLTTLGVFSIEQANNFAFDSGVPGKKDYFVQDGLNKYEGVELSVSGQLAPKWNFMGGLMYLDAVQDKTQGGKNDGKRVNGAAKWNAVGTLEYVADDKFSVVGRVLYTGKADIYNEQLSVPSFVTYDLGMSYKTKINDMPVKLNAMCYNLTDKDYWTAHGSDLLLSTPRTFFVSAEFEI